MWMVLNRERPAEALPIPRRSGKANAPMLSDPRMAKPHDLVGRTSHRCHPAGSGCRLHVRLDVVALVIHRVRHRRRRPTDAGLAAATTMTDHHQIEQIKPRRPWTGFRRPRDRDRRVGVCRASHIDRRTRTVRHRPPISTLRRPDHPARGFGVSQDYTATGRVRSPTKLLRW